MKLHAAAIALLLPVVAHADLPVDITRHGIVYRVPGMEAVKVQEGVALTGAPRFDLYRPAAARGRLPVVVFVNGVGGKLKDWEIYRDWARLVATRGMAAVLHENDGARTPETLAALLARLHDGGAALGLDPERIGVWACSGNVHAALPLLMDGAPAGVRAAVIYYGAGSAKALRRDLPVYWVLAGKDSPALIQGERDLWARAIGEGAPWTMVNAPTLPHAFDAVDPGQESRRIVAATLAFLEAHLGELPPPLPPSRSREILAYFYGQEEDKALAALQQMVADDPDDAGAWRALADSQRRRDPAAAMRSYERALTLHPNDQGTMRSLAILASQTGQCARHAGLFTRLEGVVSDAPYLSAQAACEWLGGKPEEAARTIERALTAGANPGLLHYNLACFLALGGRGDDAMAVLEKAVKVGWTDGATMARDADLASLRARPRFKALLRRLGQAKD